ncbi:hypothetical protein C8R45DRAFT_938065 [Mycena sanguinolenta]|nr:hypothetical protein C8R45DRAFT_938065 [Mycena sanguinolenta]
MYTLSTIHVASRWILVQAGFINNTNTPLCTSFKFNRHCGSRCSQLRYSQSTHNETLLDVKASKRRQKIIIHKGKESGTGSQDSAHQERLMRPSTMPTQDKPRRERWGRARRTVNRDQRRKGNVGIRSAATAKAKAQPSKTASKGRDSGEKTDADARRRSHLNAHSARSKLRHPEKEALTRRENRNLRVPPPKQKPKRKRANRMSQGGDERDADAQDVVST